MYKSIIAFVLCLSLVVVPVVQRSTVEAVAVSSTVAGLILLILLALGFTFTVSNSDITEWLDVQINKFLTYKGYSSTDEWLGDGWASSISTSGSFVGVPFSVWKKVNEMAQYSVQQGDLPAGGSLSDPSRQRLYGGASTVLSINSSSYGSFPVYSISMFNYVGQFSSYHVYTGDLISNTLNPFSLGNVYDISSNGTVRQFRFVSHTNTSYNGVKTVASDNWVSVIPFDMFSGSASIYNVDTSYPVYLVLIAPDTSSFCFPCLLYHSYSSSWCLAIGPYGFSSASYYGLSYSVNESSLDVSGTGVTPYPDITEEGGMIYIDGQMGDLTSGNAALINLLYAVNQNLVRATVALQELNAGDLPVDTSPFIQLVESYENITNDIISGSVSISSGLSSMYTLLSNSLSSITNPALSDACINAYNAFLNKIQLFRDGGGSSSAGNMQSVQDFQDYLSGLTGSFSSRASSATSQLDVYIGQASGLMEINALYSAYSAYMQSLGFEIDLVTDIKSDISSINTAVDNYFSGDITRDEALTNIRTAFKTGIRHAKTGEQLGAVSSAYSAALDQLAVRELDLEVAAGNTIGDTLVLEADLAGQFQLSEYEAYLQFNAWRFVDHTEGSLYREYFERFLDEQSPFYVFLYLPLALGLTGLLLGSAIQFGVKSKHAVGSHNSNSVR